MEERTFDIDFNSALGEALSQNPEYRKSNFDLLVAQDNKTIAFSAFLPSLSIGMAHSTSVGKMADLPDLDMERSRDALDLAKESVAAAQEDVNLAREKYNLGAATILEVLDAEVSLKQAQTNQVQALFDYNLAISRL